jgi:hypothetical protein
MKPSITLYFDPADRFFADTLASRLRDSGTDVAFWNEVGPPPWADSALQPQKCKHAGVILSPNFTSSEQMRAKASALLTDEITDGEPTILTILHQNCEIPVLLRDKRYADCRTGVTRRSLEQILGVIGGRYKPFRREKASGPFSAMDWAETEFLKLRRQDDRYRFATALKISISPPVIRERPDLAVPLFIAEEYQIPVANQHSQGLALSWKGMEKYLTFTTKVPGRVRGLERRYSVLFGRAPAKGVGSPYYCILSYGEVGKFGRFVCDLDIPACVSEYVMFDKLPELVDIEKGVD